MNWDPLMISDVHQYRLRRYAQVKGMSEDKAIHELIQIHRSGRNMALHLSMTIEENHNNYIQTLVSCGETAAHIR